MRLWRKGSGSNKQALQVLLYPRQGVQQILCLLVTTAASWPQSENARQSLRGVTRNVGGHGWPETSPHGRARGGSWSTPLEL